jgi:hypothetical protein
MTEQSEKTPSAGTKFSGRDYHPSGFARKTFSAAILVPCRQAGCVSMIAASLSPTVGLHPVSVRCRPGGRWRSFRQLLIFE